MRYSLLNRFWSILLLGAIALPVGVLRAQTVFTVTTNAGDQSTNSLGWAVTSLNAAGDGAISINNGSANVTLTQTLPSLTSGNVTLQGDSLNLFGQNNSQSQFLVQGNLVQQDQFYFQNIGGGGSGLDIAVTAQSWTANSGFTNILAGSSASTTLIGGSGFTTPDGGNASGAIGILTSGQGFHLLGGNGGNVTDTNGNGDTGGNGGDGHLTGTSLVFTGTADFVVAGGNGGSVNDLGTGTAQVGGNGGSATITYGFISVGSSGSLYVTAGQGGAAMQGGDGGNAVVNAGLLTTAQGFSVFAGNGGTGTVASGNGGSASVSMGSFSESGNGRLQVYGGKGGDGAGSGGDGGNSNLTGGSITLTGSSGFLWVLGGDGGSATLSGAFANGGNGGTASVTLANLIVNSATNLRVSGGNGGNASGGSTGGAGGVGGSTVFNLGNLVLNNSLNLTGGYGGVGGTALSGGTGGQGGSGGDLAVTVGSVTLLSGANLNLVGGAGGSGGAVASGGTGGNGGSGGDVTLSAGSVTLSSGASIVISGGAGGFGGLAGTSGTFGANGQALASFGNLTGAGFVNMGQNSTLQISQGDFTGLLSGGENLQKTSGATLVLGGANNYAGGTSILAGTLAVDTGGSLGSGIVQVESGSLLTYLNSADASNETIVNNAGASLVFTNSSTAGSASVTNDSIMTFLGTSSAGGAQVTDSSGATVYFLGSSMGASSSMDILSGGQLNLAAHSGALTVGSILGDGSITLGSNALFDGTNNQASTFSGDITGTGSFTKIGTGTLTLASENDFTGGTSILGGTLAAATTYALGKGSVVNSAVLMGQGTTFQVWNNYIQTSTGTLKMGIGGTGASSADKMNVGGTTSLDGTLELFDSGGLTAAPLGSTLTLIVGGGTLSGVFQNVTENFIGARFLPVYIPGTTSSAVELLSINPSFQTSASTPNQKAIGMDLDQVVFKPQLNGLMSFLGTLSDPDVRTAMTELSPEDFVSLYSLGFQGAAARFDAVDQRLNQLREDVDETLWMPGFSQGGMTLFAANMPASRERRMTYRAGEDWSGFLSANGGVYQVDADANAAGYKTTSFGLTAAGLDIRLSREAAAGLLLSYQHGDATLGSGGTLADDEAQAGFYGMVYADGFYAEGLVEGGLHTVKTQRTGYNGIAVATPQGTQFDGDLELGYAFDSNKVHLGPYGALQYTVVQVNAFNETGSQAPLSYPSQSADSFLAQAGLQANGNLKLGDGSVLTPGIKVAFEHEFDYQGGTFQAGLGTGDVFTVAGPVVGQDGFLASVGGDLAIGKELHFFLDYQGQFGRADLSSHQVDLGSRIGF